MTTNAYTALLDPATVTATEWDYSTPDDQAWHAWVDGTPYPHHYVVRTADAAIQQAIDGTRHHRALTQLGWTPDRATYEAWAAHFGVEAAPDEQLHSHGLYLRWKPDATDPVDRSLALGGAECRAVAFEQEREDAAAARVLANPPASPDDVTVTPVMWGHTEMWRIEEPYVVETYRTREIALAVAVRTLAADRAYDARQASLPPCGICGAPATMSASLGPACEEHYDELSN